MMSKNIAKIQSMIDGTHQRKIQVGYKAKTTTQRKEGERWTDGNGTDWEVVDGKRKQITKIPPRGFDKCSECEKLILKQLDQDTYNRMHKCYHCQVNFELDLKAEGKWHEWVWEQEQQRWTSVEEELQLILKDMKDSSDQAFDPRVANAMANENVDMTIKKNTGDI
jgi:hypothetical protein